MRACEYNTTQTNNNTTQTNNNTTQTNNNTTQTNNNTTQTNNNTTQTNSNTTQTNNKYHTHTHQLQRSEYKRVAAPFFLIPAGTVADESFYDELRSLLREQSIVLSSQDGDDLAWLLDPRRNVPPPENLTAPIQTDAAKVLLPFIFWLCPFFFSSYIRVMRMCRASCVMRHASCVMCHASCVMSHESCAVRRVMRHASCVMRRAS